MGILDAPPISAGQEARYAENVTGTILQATASSVVYDIKGCAFSVKPSPRPQ